VTAEGFDRSGTYAFFKAYRALPKDIDALYLTPLWGFDSEKMRQFYAMVARDGVPAISAENEYHAVRGAMMSTSAESALDLAHYHAVRAVQIIEGATPADLETIWDDTFGLSVNDQTARQVGIDPDRFGGYHIEAPPADDIERLTAVDAVSLALSQNPGYQARQAQLVAAGEAVGEVRSAYLPQIMLEGSLEHFDDNAVNNDPRYEADRARLGLRLDQELFALDVIHDIRAASQKRDRAENDLRQAGLDLELALTEAFLNVYQADQIRLAEIAHGRQVDGGLRMARLRVKLENWDYHDVWRWDQEKLTSRQAIRRAEANLAIARLLLNALMGRPGDYPFVLDWQHYSDSRFFTEESYLRQWDGAANTRRLLIDHLLERSGFSSPGIADAGLAIRLKQNEQKRNRSGFLPRVGFYGALDLTNEWAEYPGFEEKNPSWSVGAQVELPLFLGGRRFQTRARLDAELSHLEYRQDQASLDNEKDLRVAVELLYSRAEEFLYASRGAELANKIYPGILSQYSHGDRTSLELLDAAANDRRATRKAILTQIDYFRAVARALYAAGISANESNRSAGEELLNVIVSLPAEQP
jgi:outer membrane protein TolC